MLPGLASSAAGPVAACVLKIYGGGDFGWTRGDETGRRRFEVG